MKLSAMLVALLVVSPTWAQDSAAIRVAVQREKQPLLDTLRELVSIESGSSDFDGVTRIGDRISERLRALGGEVEKVPPASGYLRPAPGFIEPTPLAYRYRKQSLSRVIVKCNPVQ